MDENNLAKKVEEVVSQEDIMEELPLSSKAWRKVNPIYELLSRGFIKYVENDIIAQRISNSRNTDEMGELIGIQSFMKRLSKEKTNQIKRRLERGESIENVVDFAALQIAEDKRTKDEDVLYRMDGLPQQTRKDLYRKIRGMRTNQIYVTNEISSYLRSNERRFFRSRVIKYALIGVLSLGFLIGGYFLTRKYDIRIEKMPLVSNSLSEL